ncbi:MAG: malectin domain-containing carbohydrate-binding protein, partial [Xenococcus sp. (in: cyanobacteria)]
MAGEAVLEITIDSNNIQISNFGNNSFQIKNTGDKTIANVEMDVTNALYSDAVFDPFGKAGDTVSKPLTINSNGGTGIVAPSNASYIGAGGQAGFKGIQLVFDENNNNGFEPGETVGFSIDMDPNSVTGTKKQPLDAGSNPSWDVGGVSGAELIGSSFKVTFTDGTTATGQLQGADNQAGAQALASQDSPDLSATLKVNGLDAGDIGTYDENPSVIVNGPAGETARVVLTKGFIQPVTPYAQFLQNQLDVLAGSDFPANNAVEFQTVDVKLTGEDQDISNFFNFSGVAKFNFQGEDQLPLGFVASIIDPSNNDLSIGSVTKPIYLEFQEQNSEPNPNPKPELQNRVYGVKDGQVIIEAENTNLQGNWENIEIDGRQGVLYDGKNSFGKVPVGQTLEYNFQTDEEGNYYIALHSARHEAAMQKFANDLGNDAWVEVIDSQTNETILNPTKLFTHFGSVNEEYKWGTTFDINHEKSAATVNLSANKEYTLRISGRSDGYVLDRITLSNDGFLKNISTPESPLLEESPSQPTNDPVLPPENPSDQPNPDSSVIRINAGGDAYTDQEGNLWSADQFFTSGKTFQTTSSIAKTTDDPLYQTERWQKNLSYNIPVENGDYQVTLK